MKGQLMIRWIRAVFGWCQHDFGWPLTDAMTGELWQHCIHCGAKRASRVDLSTNSRFNVPKYQAVAVEKPVTEKVTVMPRRKRKVDGE